jgi:hypothetical protein
MIPAAARGLARKARRLLPQRGFFFDRPLVLLHSDDWGRIGVRDSEGFAQLRAAGLNLGEHPYDYYSMETAADVGALHELLASHRDRSGRPACMQMNFLTANVDFVSSSREGFKAIHLMPLADGPPGSWKRPGLLQAVRSGIEDGVFHSGLHGTTHYCANALQSCLNREGERGDLVRTLWAAETPYIHWRMPWAGYEYWDPELPAGERFLSRTRQAALIRRASEMYKSLFHSTALSAVAPGYRANLHTHRSWAEVGVLVAQNGPEGYRPPHVDQQGLLNVYRTLDFEPGVAARFSLEHSLRVADGALRRGLPLVISMHAINFQSSLQDFRSRSLESLNHLLTALERRYPDLCFVHDADLWQIVNYGKYEHAGGDVTVTARHRLATRAPIPEALGA